MGKKIGIDLGTTYSCVSYVNESGNVTILDNSEGEQTTPSVVHFSENNEVTIGSTARQEGVLAPDRMVERVKNYMGDPNYTFTVDGVDFSASAVSALILKKLIKDAEEKLGDKIEGAVITCPAYFNEAMRAATKEAGEKAGINVIKILDEPVAAGLAYGNNKQEDMKKTVLIYDLGGGTFDCTVLKIDFQGTNKQMEQITTHGDHQLGGKDWDTRLIEYVCQEFTSKVESVTVEEMLDDNDMRVWFSENIEKAKKQLTSKSSTVLGVSFNGNKEKIEITREAFEIVTIAELNRTILLIDEMLAKKNMTIDDIDEIILVGGSTRMPQVMQKLNSVYPGKPVESYEPDKAVAMGAALVADGAQISESANTDTTQGNYTLGGESGAIEISNQDGSKTVFIEKTSKSYGLVVENNDEEIVANLILKDTVKPAHFEDIFVTKVANQASVDLRVFENDSLERSVPLKESTQMYETSTVYLSPGLVLNAKLKIAFDLDGNGVLTIILTEMDTGKVENITPKRFNSDATNAGMDEVQNWKLT
jgi:molecular chaperone DnaK (HSP70)